jgi:hypothetical protein
MRVAGDDVSMDVLHGLYACQIPVCSVALHQVDGITRCRRTYAGDSLSFPKRRAFFRAQYRVGTGQ